MVMIGTVRSIGVLQASAPGPFSSTVEVQELRVIVDLPFRNSVRAQRVRIRHPRVLPSTNPVINGFGPVIIRRGWTYLFFLKRTKRGLELTVVEDHKLVDFSRRRVRAIARWLRRPAPLDVLLRLFRERLRTCKAVCDHAIWMTDTSQAYKRRYVSGRNKRRHIRMLIRITRRTTHDNTLNAAYSVLGRYDVRSVLPRIIRVLSRKRAQRPSILSNRLSWLQGFKRSVQISALQQILARAQNKGVIRAANWKLHYLRSRKP